MASVLELVRRDVSDQACSRLESVRDVIEWELHALSALRDSRLEQAIQAMDGVHREISATLARLGEPSPIARAKMDVERAGL